MVPASLGGASSAEFQRPGVMCTHGVKSTPAFTRSSHDDNMAFGLLMSDRSGRCERSSGRWGGVVVDNGRRCGGLRAAYSHAPREREMMARGGDGLLGP